MDLFDDLPEPGAIAETKPYSPPSEHKWADVGADKMFSDLPPPVADSKVNIKRKSDELHLTSQSNKKIICEYFHLQGYVAERKGEREDMQDSHLILDDFRKELSNLLSSVSRLSFYAVFDGHGGARASHYAAHQLHRNMAHTLSKVDPGQVERDIKRVMIDTFKKTDEDFLKEARSVKPSWKDGTTAITVLALDNSLYIANIGDSKAILCRFNRETKKHTAISLSKDHSPTDYTERMRIQKAGGTVRDGRVMGILEVSRSIGDGQFKALGVTCTPDVKKCQLTKDDLFVLLACDGLWKVFTTEEVLQVVLSSLKRKDKEVSMLSSDDICFETACNRLVNEAIRKQSGDNVTVVLVAVRATK